MTIRKPTILELQKFRRSFTYSSPYDGSERILILENQMELDKYNKVIKKDFIYLNYVISTN